MADDSGISGFVYFIFLIMVLGAGIAIAIFFGTILLIAFVVAMIAIAAYKAYQNHQNSPHKMQERAHAQTIELIKATGRDSTAPASEQVAAEIIRGFPELHDDAKKIVLNFVSPLYQREIQLPTHPPENAHSLEGIRFRDELRRIQRNQEQGEATADTFSRCIEASLSTFLQMFPHAGATGATMPAHQLIPADQLHHAIHNLCLPFYELNAPDEYIQFPFAKDAKHRGLFKPLAKQLQDNLLRMSATVLHRRQLDQGERVYPAQYEGDDPIGYVRGTLLEQFVNLPLVAPSIDIPYTVRFEHMWICGGSGHGKSQALLNLMDQDFDDVAQGLKSVIVIDSQGDLINQVSHLKLFGEGEPLDGRLVLIDPTDLEYPVQLNLFSLADRLDEYEPLERERLQNAAIELYEFILGSLLGAEMTSKQQTMFRYALRAMLVIPNATIHTFRELFDRGGYEKYREYIQKLPPTARAFFETEFQSREFEATNRQVVRRLWAVLESGVFERMFSHGKSKLNLFSEMNAGKFILINTAKSLLQPSGSELFGRFFIALITQAAQERATIPADQRLPCFVYIDECHDYLDDNVAQILEQARKFNVGLTLAHQYIGQLSPKLAESFAANTAHKIVGGVSAKDARTFAPMMNCEPEFITKQPKGTFAQFIRNYMQTATELKVTFGLIDQKYERMSPRRFDAIRAINRQRYCVPISELQQPEDAEIQPLKDPDADIQPSDKW